MNQILKALNDRHFGTANWKNLGLSLGLYMPTLDTIQTDICIRTNDDCLSACLSAWLRLRDGVKKKGGATWLSLVTALCDIEENAVADGIKREYY